MNMSLFDTDILSLFFRNNKVVLSKMKAYLDAYDSIPFSIISFYEILNGLYYKDSRNLLSRFREFSSINEIIPLTLKSTNLSAQIFADLRKKGITIGHTDVLIAGIALSNNMKLVTNNIKHFQGIEGLEIESWI